MTSATDDKTLDANGNLDTAEAVRRIETDGFCVLPAIVPSAANPAICDDLLRAQSEHRADAEAELAKTRARGHRVGNQGVAPLRQIINYVQSFAPYLASRQILDVAEHFFGPWARISSTDVVINHPGNARGYWHSDWPYNATNSSHIRAPYPDALMHLASIWMFTDFNDTTGGTYLVPGSHRSSQNPAAGGIPGVDPDGDYPTQIQATGAAGSVLLYDSRLWHAVAPNRSDSARVAILVRYAPWWLNLNPAMPGRPEHDMMVVETGGKNYESPSVFSAVYDQLPADVQPLYRHNVAAM